MSIKLADLIALVPRDVEQRIKRLLDQTRPVVQEALRAECRLNLRTSEETLLGRAGARIPIKLVPGCPEALKAVEFSPEYELSLLIAPYRGSLERTASGTTELVKLQQALAAHTFFGDGPTNIGEFDLLATSHWARSLLKLLDELDPLAFFPKVNQDVLGAYFYSVSPIRGDENEPNRAHIEIYWGAIAWFADSMNYAVEDLALVAITHELAHAYTQLGADIDGGRWNAWRFNQSENALVEGLAQYYTHRILHRLEHRYPGARKVFEDFQKKQHADYSAHNKWADKVSPEAVRLAMLEVRRHEITTLDGFLERLSDAVGTIGPFRPPGSAG